MKVDHIVIPISPHITPEQRRALTQRVLQILPWVSAEDMGDHVKRCIDHPVGNEALRIAAREDSSYVHVYAGTLRKYRDGSWGNVAEIGLEDFLSYNDS